MESNLLELNRAIIRRQAGKKVLFQPRIECWYDERMFRKEPLPGAYEGCDKVRLYEKLGCSDRLYGFNACFERVCDPSVQTETRQISALEYESVITTPVGAVTQRVKRNTSNPGQMPMKWFIETLEDLRVYTYIEDATSYRFNADKYAQLYEKLAHLGLPSMFVPRVNLQKLIVELAGVENTYYLLEDEPAAVEAYFKALSRSQESILHALADSPFEWINYGDNLHCGILPPRLFERYILPEYEKRGDILRGAGKFVHSHWDGDVRAYLPYAKRCFLDGIEAITPEPQGDVTIEEVKEALGDEIVLIDGLAALLFQARYPVEQLEAAVRRTIELFAGQLVLGISDEMPSDGQIERVKLVTDMVNAYNA